MNKKPGVQISPEETELFREAVAKVQPLAHESRAAPSPGQPRRKPIRTSQRPAQGFLDEEGELFYREDLAKDMMKGLRQGRFPPCATIDLHGQTVAKAEQSLVRFLSAHTDFSFRCLLVITGKGSHSPEGYSPVRVAALDLLQSQPSVQAYCWAPTERWRHRRVLRTYPEVSLVSIATAMAAMPSSRPTKPNPSVVVALILTCVGKRPRSAAIFPHI